MFNHVHLRHDLLAINDFVARHRNRLKPLIEDVRKSAQRIVDFQSTWLNTRTTLASVELSVLFDNSDGNVVLTQSQSKDETGRSRTGLPASYQIRYSVNCRLSRETYDEDGWLRGH